MKNIKFIPENTAAEHWTLPPVPAIKELPEWYKKMSRHIEKNKMPTSLNASRNLTVKSCLPFFDSMSSGYFILLNSDVLVEQKENGPYFSWTSDEHMIWLHNENQIEGMSVPYGMSKIPFKWRNFYDIKTPKGWSCIFTHPQQRYDLPFMTISGIVDTDKFDLPVHFPFFISSEFEGIIKRGTPIAQIIPIKRDTWKSTVENSKNDIDIRLNKIHAYFEKYYKNFFWERKKYL